MWKFVTCSGQKVCPLEKNREGERKSDRWIDWKKMKFKGERKRSNFSFAWSPILGVQKRDDSVKLPDVTLREWGRKELWQVCTHSREKIKQTKKNAEEKTNKGERLTKKREKNTKLDDSIS